MSDQVFTLGDGQTVKLGRIRPKARPPALPLARYLKPEVMAALPDTFDNSAKAMSSIQQMYGNDTLGDCHPPGTLVRLADGSSKRIEEIGLSDVVMTAEGNTGQVTAVMSRYENAEVVRVVAWGVSHLRMTANHEVLTRRGYVPAGDLLAGDWIATPARQAKPIGSVVRTRGHLAEELLYGVVGAGRRGHAASAAAQRKTVGAALASFPEAISLTPGFGRIIGLFLSEGSTNQNLVCWTFSHDERDTLVAELLERLRDELGIDGVVSERRSAIYVRVCGKLWRMLFRSLCGKGADGKRLHGELMGGPPEFLAAVLSGWLDGDGHDRRGCHVGTTVSHALAMDMFNVAQTLGHLAAITGRQPKGSRAPNGPDGALVPVNASFRWDVSVTTGRLASRYKFQGSTVWREVRRIDREPYSGRVYNLEVAGDNSYIAEGIGVHNCVIAGKMHSVGVWTGNDAGAAAVGTTAEAVSSYHTICGPGDNGCVITDVLDYMKSHGLTVGGKAHKIDGYVSVNWQSQDQLKAAIYLFGAVSIGFECMERWLDQKVWDLNPGGRVAGGHDVTLLGWNGTGVLLSSWGSLYTMTWAAATSAKYLDEAYAILSPDWYGSDNLSPQHIDVVTLKTDLAVIGGGTLPPIPSPSPTPTPTPSPTPAPTPTPTPAPTPTPTPTPAPPVTLIDQPSVLTSVDHVVNGQHGVLTVTSHTKAVWTPTR